MNEPTVTDEHCDEATEERDRYRSALEAIDGLFGPWRHAEDEVDEIRSIVRRALNSEALK